MSSLASAPAGAVPETSRATPAARTAALPASPDVLAGLVLAGALTLLAFVTQGGTNLAGNTWAEIVLVLVGAALAASTLLRPIAAPRHGLGTWVCLAGLVLLIALSITWSVVPDQSWLEANRALAYLAAFGGAIVIARLWSGRWRAVISGIATLSVVLSGWALLVKVFPGTLDPVELFGRLRAPFGYWNATGVIAAMGVPPLLWTGARREAGPISRALSVPAIAVVLTALVLSYSRSAVLATVCGTALWFWLVPLRLRGALTLILGALGALAPTLWALRTHALTHDRVALGPRVDAGHGFGIVLVLALLVFAGVGFAAAFAADRTTLDGFRRRRVGAVLLACLAFVPVAGVGAMTVSSRGLTGEISHIWQSLANPKGGAVNTPGRLVQLGNTRGLYWREGFRVGEHAALKGVGAGGFGVARTRYSHEIGIVAHAHSYFVETFADLGVLGLLVSLALLGSWALETGRTFGRGPLARRDAASIPQLAQTERAGLVTLLAVVVVFGVHSSIDWTWEIPGTAIPALLCAGWLIGRRPRTPAAERPARRRRPLLAPAIAGLLTLALLAGWTIWQPLRSANAENAAIDALSARNGARALTEARTAAARDPLAPQPLWTLADVLTATGDLHGAHLELVKAVSLQPDNPATWRELGFFDVLHDQPRKAIGVLTRAHQLDPTDVATDQEINQARISLAAKRSARP